MLVFLILIEILIQGIPNDYKYKDKILRDDTYIETLILGHSQARDALNPKYFSTSTFNFANSAQSLNYDYQILKRALKNKPELKNVILPISFFSLHFTTEDATDDQLTKNYRIYMDFDVPSIKHEYEIITGLSLKPQFSRIFDYYILNITPKISLNGFSAEEGYLDEDLVNSHAKTAFETYNEYIISGNNYNKNMLLLEKIIDLIINNNLNLILFIPPLQKPLINEIPDAYTLYITELCKSLESKNENIYFYNDFDTDDLSFKDFRDSNHLNKSGAKKFTTSFNIFMIKNL